MKSKAVASMMIALALAGLAAGHVLARVTPLIPPGVDPENWQPINDSLGIVLERPPSRAVTVPPLLVGTLYARTDRGWARVAFDPPPGSFHRAD